MGAPSITISFIEKAMTAVTRGERGIVMLWVKDTLAAPAVNPVTVVTEKDIPDSLKDATVEQIKLAMIGYTNAPKKVIVYCMGIADDAEKAAIDVGYKKAMETSETIKFNYLAIPTVETDQKVQEVATWVKTMRDVKKKKIKAVLPNTAADNEGIINYTTETAVKTETVTAKNGTKTTVDTKYTAEQYCARIAGLIAGTPMTIACTYAPLSELSDCTRLLLNILKRRIKDERLIKLFDKIINSEKRAFGLPLGVDPCEIDPREMLFDKGMPIGNLTSQMFANIYMNELDQYLKHELHLKYVIRYADDCIILHDSKEELWQVLEKVETFLLENLKLNLNNKTVIRPTTCNIDFVGYMINKDEIRLRSATVKRMRSRIKYIVKAYERGEMTLQEVNATMQSYFGLIKHCTNEGLRENIINGFVLHCTDAARAKARESR